MFAKRDSVTMKKSWPRSDVKTTTANSSYSDRRLKKYKFKGQSSRLTTYSETVTLALESSMMLLMDDPFLPMRRPTRALWARTFSGMSLEMEINGRPLNWQQLLHPSKKSNATRVWSIILLLSWIGILQVRYPWKACLIVFRLMPYLLGLFHWGA